jgi:hypothetical protein
MTRPAWLWIMRAAGLLTVLYGIAGYLGWRHLAKEGVFRDEDWRVVIACVIFVGLCLVVASYLRPFGHLDQGADAPRSHPR